MIPRVIIRTVPERAAYADYLRERIPHAEWCIDTAQDPVGNFVAALALQGSDDAIHLEDDALLCVNWAVRVGEDLDVYGHNAVVNWFSARPAQDRIGTRIGEFISSLCFHLPGPLALPAVEWFDTWPGHPHPSLHPQRLYDLGLQAFLKAHDIATIVRVPCLVQHRYGPSQSGHTGMKSYRATRHLPIDMGDGLVELEHPPGKAVL